MEGTSLGGELVLGSAWLTVSPLITGGQAHTQGAFERSILLIAIENTHHGKKHWARSVSVHPIMKHGPMSFSLIGCECKLFIACTEDVTNLACNAKNEMVWLQDHYKVALSKILQGVAWQHWQECFASGGSNLLDKSEMDFINAPVTSFLDNSITQSLPCLSCSIAGIHGHHAT